MKAVYDTNVLVSALVFPGGSPEKVLELARLGEITLVLSPEILEELRAVLVKKFRYALAEAEQAVDLVAVRAQIVYPTRRLHVIRRKDSDNRILEAAVTAVADYLVSGDKRDILPLKKIASTSIVTPAEFLDILASGYK